MKYVNLGSTGLKVSRICLGTMTYGSKKWREWGLEDAEARPFYRRAIEAGITFFDTADIYSLGVSEEITGRALKEYGPSRDKLVIATKVFNAMGSDPNQQGLSRKHIMHAIDDSLRRLQTDYVDLYQIHRFDPHTPIEETLEALDQVVRAGKALYIGASSMYAWQFLKMLQTSDLMGLARFVSMQNHYNLVYREEEREMIPLCLEEGVGLIPWSPLARGRLARTTPSPTEGTTRADNDPYAVDLYDSPSDSKVIDAVRKVASELGIQPSEVALAWLLQKPWVTAPSVRATKIEHLESAVRALDIKLSEEHIRAVEEPYQPHAARGH